VKAAGLFRIFTPSKETTDIAAVWFEAVFDVSRMDDERFMQNWDA
jgi:hypothetical protein